MTITKIFDPADGFAPITDAAEMTDSSVFKRGNRWWMVLAGEGGSEPGLHLFSASLPDSAALSATGWQLTADATDSTKIAPLAGYERSAAWDLKGGRHCPSHVKGWDPQRGEWVERIYYAGAAENMWGPYAIGYLEWDGATWVDQTAPVFVAEESWEHGSVYEPNLIYADGKWKLWFVAGSNQEDYLVHGFAESADGRLWTGRKIFAPAEMKMFDFCVREVKDGYEAVFSRVWVGKTAPPASTGLWWCRADVPSAELSEWSAPVQIMTAENRGWHKGPWKPSFQDGESGRLFIFFDGGYMKAEPGGFPFAFTLGCLEIEAPTENIGRERS